MYKNNLVIFSSCSRKLLDLNLFCLFCLPRFPIYNSVFFCSGFTLNPTSEMAHQFCATSQIFC